MIYVILYLLTIVAANIAIDRIGFVPVGFDHMAPAGVYFVGLAFTLRDFAHEAVGRRGVLIAIVGGAGLSAVISPELAVASGVAFLLSELADFAVYSPLREKRWMVAVFASNIVGLTIDSALFLWLAFGNLDFLTGQIVGKFWMTMLAIGFLTMWRLARDLPLGVRAKQLA